MLKSINKNSIALRYLLLVGGLLIIGQLLSSLFGLYQNNRQQQADLYQKAFTQANFLGSVSADNVLGDNFYPLETLMRQTNADPDFVYSIILHQDGRPLTNYLNTDDQIVLDAIEQLDRPKPLQVTEIIANSPGIEEIRSPIIAEGLLIGEVRLGYTDQSLGERFRSSLVNTILSSLLLAGLLFLLTLLLFNRQIQKPIDELQTAARQFAAGDFDARASGDGQNEFSQLQATFNNMAGQIQNNLLELGKLSHVASRTKNMVIICDAEGRIEWVNEAFTETTEYSLAEIEGLSPGHFLQGPDSDPEVTNYMRSKIQAGEGFGCVILNYSKSGGSYWVQIEAQPVYDEQQNLINFIAIETDITEKRSREIQIRESEMLKSGILTTALDAIISIDDKGSIIEFNPAAETIFGRQKDDVLGEQLAEIIIPPDLRENHREGFDAYLKTGVKKVIGRRIELPALRADGSIFPAEVAITALELEGKHAFTAYLRDISEKKTAEEKLRQYAEDTTVANINLTAQQNRLRSLLDIATTNPVSEVSELYSAIAQGARSLGMEISILSQIESNRFNVVEVYAPSYSIESGQTCPLDTLLCQQTINQNSIYSTVDLDPQEMVLPDWFGSFQPRAYIGTPIHLNGKLFGTLSFLSDRKRLPFSESESDFFNLLAQWITVTLERQLALHVQENYATELERSNKELVDFAYVASHDLQEPLRKIQAFGSRLESQYTNTFDERGLDYLQRMQNAANRMQTLIEELLTYSRVTTKAKPFEQVDLSTIVEEVLSDLEIKIEQTDAELVLAPLATIDGDPIQLRQVFQNIIGNALKFTVPGRKPIIRIEGQTNDFHETGPVYIIKITDNGIGINEKYNEKIFGIFQRLHGKHEYEGTGVGLAICRKIIERHNGKISVQSQPNEGSTFSIQLPTEQLNKG